MGVIGTSPPRSDGLDKLRGTAGYVDDLAGEDTWHGATVRTSVACGTVLAIDAAAARAADPDVVVVTAADLPGPNVLPVIQNDWPVLADGTIEHLNQPVALVAAPTRARARAAADLVSVEVEPSEPVLGLDAAHEVLASCSIDHGDVDVAIADAEHVIEGTFESGLQEHVYIETQGMLARVEGGVLTVVGSLQCPYYLQHALEAVFAPTGFEIRVTQATTGGGFGGKEEFPDQIGAHAALLAWKSGHEVVLLYDRHEDIIGTTKRHPARVTHRTAVSGDGTLIAQDIEVLLDGGAFVTLSPVVLSRAVIHAGGPYRCRNVRIRGRVLKTNTPPNGAFRGFGAPQSQLGAERQMDQIARRLGIDPLTARRINAYRDGDVTPTGQVLDASTSALEVLETTARRADFLTRWKTNESARVDALDDGAPRDGIGIALAWHGSGFTGDGERRLRARAGIEVDDGGRPWVLSASTDFGQGTEVVFQQIVAEALGVFPEDVGIRPPDTHLVPDSGPTVASRTVMIVGSLLHRAAREIRGRVGDGPEPFQERAAAWIAANGPLKAETMHQTPPGATFDESTYRGVAYPAYGWICDVVEVSVDPDTLLVTPRKVTVACDVGRAVNPALCAGQIEGGTLQAVAWAYLEEVKCENGRYLNDRLQTCLIPTTRDAPELDVRLVENPSPAGPLGTKGVGEIPMDAGAPATLAAIENATGIAASSVPATPERLLELMEDAP